jgi:hypothetical protein
MQVKAMVASCFTQDASDLIEIFLMGWRSERNNRSYRWKLFTNLWQMLE